MKTLSMLCVGGLLLGCGGSSEEAKEPVAPVAPAEEMATPEAGVEPAQAAPMTPAEQPAAPAAEAPAPMPATPMRATAELKSIPGDQPVGTLTFEKQGNMVAISGQFSGLKKGERAMYIHENGDCGNKGKAAGGHFNPTSAKHGPIDSGERHAGDFGNIMVDEAGAATFSTTTDSITIEPDGPSSVVGKAVVIHAKKDDKKGNAGPAIACGVITAAE